MEKEHKEYNMSKRTPGLQFDKENQQWSIDKRIKGFGRLRQRLRSRTVEEAEIEFHHIISAIHNNEDKDPQSSMTFYQAGIKYIKESTKKSLDRDVVTLKACHPFLKDLTLNQVHNDSLQPFIAARKKAGIRSGTVNRDIAVIRSILRLAANKWRTIDGKPFLIAPPLFDTLNWEDKADPFPINKKEQLKFFRLLPKHLRRMAFFAVNTGLREQGVCWLRWDWELEIPELNTSIFVIPGKKREYADGTWIGEKNKENQVVVLNCVAKSLIEVQRRNRENNCPYVFPYRGKRIGGMNNTGWQDAWTKAGFPLCKEICKGPHNLKHTFGRRLRNAGVSLETRKVLLHHKNGDITTHYSPAEVSELLTASEKVTKSISTTLIK